MSSRTAIKTDFRPRRMPQHLADTLIFPSSRPTKQLKKQNSAKKFRSGQNLSQGNSSESSDDESPTPNAPTPKFRPKSVSLPDNQLYPRKSLHDLHSPSMEKKTQLRRSKSRAFLRRKELYRKFKVVGKIALFWVHEMKQHMLRNKVFDEVSPYTHQLQFIEIEPEEELLFDRSKFKANRQLRISEETKRILTKESFDRTEKEIHYAMVSLRNNPAFAQYPIRMQKKIAEVGIYCSYGAKRLIVRQGHPATYFYFILSGALVVMVAQGGVKVPKPVAYLKRGQTFGELAIIHRTIRQGSCIAKEQIELLSIDFRDFHRIFMSGGIKNINDPDHNQFLRNVRIFDGWPIEKMMDEENSKKSLFHYFKNGEVLVKDSNLSDWVFVIKTGSVNVLKKLKRVRPYEWRKENYAQTLKKSIKQKREEQRNLEAQRRYILPDLNIPLRSLQETEDQAIEDLQYHTIFPRLTHSVDISNEERKRENSEKAMSILSARSRRNESCSKKQSVSSGGSVDSLQLLSNSTRSFSDLAHPTEEKKSSKVHWDTISEQNPQQNSVESNGTDTLQGDMKSSTETKAGPKNGKVLKKGLSKRSLSRFDSTLTNESLDEEAITKILENQKNSIRTITQDLDSKMKDPDDLTDADLDPQFVHIQTLTKGMFFGLYDLVFETEQPSFCLVSNGAECIMLDKHFYWSHTTEALRRNLLLNCSPYPTDEDLQSKLQVSIDWTYFRTNTFKDTLATLSNTVSSNPFV